MNDQCLKCLRYLTTWPIREIVNTTKHILHKKVTLWSAKQACSTLFPTIRYQKTKAFGKTVNTTELKKKGTQTSIQPHASTDNTSTERHKSLYLGIERSVSHTL